MKKDLGNGFDAQMMLDLYIHDYLVRNNLHTVAETFSQEANFQPKPVAVDDGLLSDWWSFFWNVYCSRPGNDPVAHQSCADVQTNPHPVSPLPDPNYIVQNHDPMLNAVNSPRPYDPMLNTLNSPPSHDMLAQLPNQPQAEAEMGSGEEPYWRNVDHLLNVLDSPSPYDPTLAQLPNLPQADAEMGSVDQHFWRKLDHMLKALDSPSQYDPTLAQLANLPQAEAEMGSAEEPFRQNLEPTLNALNSPSPYDPALAQLPNLPQAEAEMGSQHVHARKPPRNPDAAIKAMADSHQFSLRPEMGSSSYHINNWQQSPTVSRPNQICASNAHSVSQPPDPNIPLPNVEELDPMINAILNALNSLPPYDPTLAQLHNLPQISSNRVQRVANWLKNRRRACDNDTGLRRPNT